VRVRAGQLLGLTGQTGNAADTAPHVHFGISHPTTPDDWVVRRGEVDPYPYLRAWAEGRDVTPPVG
jgi:peptidoglycan LD-endopeptidase LytH